MYRYILSFFILFNSFVFAQDAVYSLDFISNWNSSTHPTDFPPASHWSSLVGTTHNSSVDFWGFGQLATQGVEDVAELGLTFNITQEINTAIANGNAYQAIEFPLGFGQIFTIESITIDADFPYISLMTMLAPSPDWLAEIHNVKLTDDFGNWKSTVSVPVYVTDSGTDSGTTFISTDIDTNPPEMITSLENTFPFSNQIIATFVFDLSQILNVSDDEFINSISIYPNPTSGNIFINSSNENIIENIKVYDITGKEIKNYNNLLNQQELNFSSIKSGLYFLKITSNNGSIVKKVIKK